MNPLHQQHPQGPAPNTYPPHTEYAQPPILNAPMQGAQGNYPVHGHVYHPAVVHAPAPIHAPPPAPAFGPAPVPLNPSPAHVHHPALPPAPFPPQQAPQHHAYAQPPGIPMYPKPPNGYPGQPPAVPEPDDESTPEEVLASKIEKQKQTIQRVVQIWAIKNNFPQGPSIRFGSDKYGYGVYIEKFDSEKPFLRFYSKMKQDNFHQPEAVVRSIRSENDDLTYHDVRTERDREGYFMLLEKYPTYEKMFERKLQMINELSPCTQEEMCYRGAPPGSPASSTDDMS